MGVSFPGTQDSIRKRLLVWRIRIDLCFQAKAKAVLVDLVPTPGQGTIEIIPGVKLNATLIGIYLQYPACAGLSDTGGKSNISILVIENPIMVITLAVRDLDMLRTYTCTNLVRLGKIKRGAGHFHEASSRDSSVAGWHHTIGDNVHLVVENAVGCAR